MSGHKKLFHVLIKVMIPAAEYADFITGMYIEKKILTSPNPSILAASMISFGNIFEFCLKKKIKNAVDIPGNMIAR